MSGRALRFFHQFSFIMKHKLMNGCLSPFPFRTFLNQHMMDAFIHAGNEINQSIFTGYFYRFV